MTLPVVAIVGRTNVGKSRLFNRLAGKFKALVDDTAGVTRDRHYSQADWRGKSFMLVDTGGLIPGSEDPLNKKVWQQAFVAIQEADILICALDGQDGLTPVDEVLVQELRRINKPCLYAVNKIDTGSQENMLFDFARLGIEPLIAVSAEHGRGVSDLMEALHPKLEVLQGSPQKESDAFEGDLGKNVIKGTKDLCLSIVGRPNVGKSALINQLAKEERVVVHEEAGTTRDAIDVVIEKEGKSYLFVDTAGIKKKSATKGRLEKFSVIHSLKSIDQSQIVLLLLDATQGLTHQDLHLAHYVWENGKGLLILVNKWDLMKSSEKKYLELLQPQLGELQRVPLLCISAKTGAHCPLLWKYIEKMETHLTKRVETSLLNSWLEEMTASHPPASFRGRNVRVYYGTQVGVAPPHIVLFVNEPKGISTAYQRYLKNRLMEAMGLEGFPIRLSIRRRGKER